MTKPSTAKTQKPTELTDEILICNKTKHWVVHWQNEACLLVCGNQVGKECRKNCAAICESIRNEDRLGMYSARARFFENTFYDIAVFETQTEILSLLYRVSPVGAIDPSITASDLTARELEIWSLRSAGLSNGAICKNLNISKSTLKTHIRHINEKIKSSAK